MRCNRIFLLVVISIIGFFVFACESGSDLEDVDGDTDVEAESDAEGIVDGDDSTDGDEKPGDGDSEIEDESEAETDAVVEEGMPPRPDYAPSLLVKPEDKARILERLNRYPYNEILAQISSVADRQHVDTDGPNIFDSWEQQNGETAMSAAFLAWLSDDEAYAQKARDFLVSLSDAYDTHEDGDINIRLPSIVMGFTFALDFLQGADMIPHEEAIEAERKLTTIVDAFYADYIENPINRVFIYYTQNNHPIRTACSIGMAALAFPEHPEARKWADWAFSELDYLWGPNGQYVQPDGGVSEGSLYYRFAFGPTLMLFTAWHNRIGAPRQLTKNCINRNDNPPWTDHGCIDGEPFVFEDPLFGERFLKSVDWFLALRMPDGQRPPMEDSSPKRANGGAVLANWLDRPDLVWDWQHDELNMGGGFDTKILHLAYAPEYEDPQPPSYTHIVLPDAGQAVFRSGWGPSDVWAMMTAEHGSARMTVHDHVDGGSFTLFAYGEYILIDTGYYKPDMSNNALTSAAPAHSLLMIEEEPVPGKGLLNNFGDTDAFLENEYISEDFAYVEARQPIDISTTIRHMMMVSGRYLIVANRIETPNTEIRHHTWRLHGATGYDMGGLFELREHGARWQMEKAGVDVYLSATEAGLNIEEPPYEPLTVPHVAKYLGDAEDHAVMDGVLAGVKPGFLSVVAPYAVGAAAVDASAPLTVTQLTADGVAEGVTAWLVERADAAELAVLRTAAAPERLSFSSGHVIETDAELAVVRISGTPPLAMIARGSKLIVDGNNRIDSVAVPVKVVQE